MSATEESDSRLSEWKETWENNFIPFHIPKIHKMLEKHVKLLAPEGKPQKIFFPLCGKAVDMKWLADQGHSIVGVDGVKTALEQFYDEQKLEWTEKEATKMGTGCQLLESSDGNMKLYCGDIMIFNESVEGLFDAVWDRGSLVALNKTDHARYVEMLKNILKPGGRIILEVFEYDKATYAGILEQMPHAMFEAEIKSLYEPECTAEIVDRDAVWLKTANSPTAYYLIVKR